LFLYEIIDVLIKEGIFIPVKISKVMEVSTIAGSAGLVINESKEKKNGILPWRKTFQNLMPQISGEITGKDGEYNIYPFQSLGGGKIFSGYQSLTEWIRLNPIIAIEGFIGNDWSAIRENLSTFFNLKKISVLWYETSAFRKAEDHIEKMVSPFLGYADSVLGTKATLNLEDFYKMDKLKSLQPETEYDVIIIIGIGAALCDRKMPVIYVDLPKNEIQYRVQAGSISNLGVSEPADPSAMYKRFYFVDWEVLNRYRQQIKEKISVVADGQCKDNISWTLQSSLNEGFELLSHSVIRARPWFAAGAWGGDWMKKHIHSLNKNEINYAWSFELIVPENGLVFESDGNLLEVAFDWLMEHNSKEILGKDAERFGTEFPIRFDFLDTFNGGNLSIQCHPSLKYIRKNFGERITQDETYYIMDCKDNAKVYLGFCKDIVPDEFKKVLEESAENNSR
jgi:hypothetical protein